MVVRSGSSFFVSPPRREADWSGRGSTRRRSMRCCRQTAAPCETATRRRRDGPIRLRRASVVWRRGRRRPAQRRVCLAQQRLRDWRRTGGVGLAASVRRHQIGGVARLARQCRERRRGGGGGVAWGKSVAVTGDRRAVRLDIIFFCLGSGWVSSVGRRGADAGRRSSNEARKKMKT